MKLTPLDESRHQIIFHQINGKREFTEIKNEEIDIVLISCLLKLIIMDDFKKSLSDFKRTLSSCFFV